MRDWGQLSLSVLLALQAFGGMTHAGEEAGVKEAKVYCERFRPQFHFSMKKGWINDPNGLVYYDGVYHLFCQHNPDDIKWGPMHWSHAVSADLVNWKEQPIAIYPDELGTIFSGSAAVDRRNTSGLGTEDNPPILAFYTAAGSQVKPPRPFTQCLAYSADNGKTWKKYKDNPVLNNVAGGNRDPKVFWYSPRKIGGESAQASEGHWVMILYLTGSTFALFGSPDALHWEELSRFEATGNCECPDLFEMPVEGGNGRTKWVFLSGAGKWTQGDCARYMIGDFDGKRFKPESELVPIEWGGWNYSTQTFSDAPAGRRVFVGWFSTAFDAAHALLPGNPFNGQYRVPWELKLVDTESGLRLSRKPVEELKKLRQDEARLEGGPYEAGEHAVKDANSRSLDIECEIEPGSAKTLSLVFEGVNGIAYDVAAKTLQVLERKHEWPLEKDGSLKLRILFDVNCLEVFGPDGLKVMSSVYKPDTLKQLDESRPKLALHVAGGGCTVRAFTAWKMKSIWE